MTVVSTLGESITSVPGELNKKFRSVGKNFRMVKFLEQFRDGSCLQKDPIGVKASRGGGIISQGKQ